MSCKGPFMLDAFGILEVSNTYRGLKYFIGPFPYHTSYRFVNDKVYIRVKVYRWPNENPYMYGEK